MTDFFLYPKTDVLEWINREGGYTCELISNSFGTIEKILKVSAEDEHHACMFKLFFHQHFLIKETVDYYLKVADLYYLRDQRIISQKYFDRKLQELSS